MSNPVKANLSVPHDDRWHYLDFPDNAHRAKYIEWKYFNFIQEDLEGYIIYYLLDPEKKTTHGGGWLLVRILKDGKIYGLVKKIETDKIEIDALSAGIRMDGARIIEEDPHHYKLEANLKDVSWSLNYKQKVPTIESYQNIHTGIARWERVSWLIKMPQAQVTGDVRIGETTFHINALGYSDTNWGEIFPYFSRYEWGQYNDKSFSLVFGVLLGWIRAKPTYCYFAIDKKVVTLESKECKVKHLEWVKDETTGAKIPAKSEFLFKSKEYEVKFSTSLLRHDTPGMIIHPLLPKVFVSEQIVHYQGSVKRDGVLLHEFEGKGFQEWSGTTWKKVLAPF